MRRSKSFNKSFSLIEQRFLKIKHVKNVFAEQERGY